VSPKYREADSRKVDGRAWKRYAPPCPPPPRENTDLCWEARELCWEAREYGELSAWIPEAAPRTTLRHSEVVRYRVTNQRVVNDGDASGWKAVLVTPDPHDLYCILSIHSTREHAQAACERDFVSRFGERVSEIPA
jgi:hypothetical protein